MDIGFADIWLPVILAFLSGAAGGGTLVFFLYDRWATKVFNINMDNTEEILKVYRAEIEGLEKELDELSKNRKP